MKRLVVSILVAVSLCAASAGCTHTPPVLAAKSVATTVVSDSTSLLDAAYRAELAVVATSPVKVPDVAQNKILTSFATAFDKLAAASKDLQSVQPGTAVPDSVSGVIQSLRDVVNVINEVAPGSQFADVAKKIQAVIDTITNAGKEQ